MYTVKNHDSPFISAILM